MNKVSKKKSSRKKKSFYSEVLKYLRNAREELNKVTFPTKNMLIKSIIVVLSTTVISALIFIIMDFGLNETIKKIYDIKKERITKDEESENKTSKLDTTKDIEKKTEEESEIETGDKEESESDDEKEKEKDDEESEIETGDKEESESDDEKEKDDEESEIETGDKEESDDK